MKYKIKFYFLVIGKLGFILELVLGAWNLPE
jgi:hypothetical protein